MNNIGTMAIGVRTPIIRKGDDLVNIVISSVLELTEKNNISLEDRDIIAITESVLARCQGNYATVEDIANDIRNKFNNENIGVLFPIMSRNRFGEILKGIAKGTTGKVIVQLSFPKDEVGNPLTEEEALFLAKPFEINRRIYDAKSFRKRFGIKIHPFTKVNYIDYYESLAPNIGVIVSNNPLALIKYTSNILVSSIHRRHIDRKAFEEARSLRLYDLTQILNRPSKVHGYNQEYGLLGSNLSREGVLKLFPRDGQEVVEEIQEKIYNLTKKLVEVMIYGDGAFKDPSWGIWELADPVVAPFYTNGLIGTPSEKKLKYLADSTGMSEKEILEVIKEHSQRMGELGTTPRNYSDLIGSLCDLVSGSGDKGTPVVLVKNYFKNLADE